MPSLVVIGQQINEKRGAPPSLNRVKRHLKWPTEVSNIHVLAKLVLIGNGFW